MEHDLRLFLGQLTNRSRLDETEQEAILALPTDLVQVNAQRDIVRPGQRVDHVSVVVGGVAARFGQNDQGGRQITALHISGDAPDLHLVVVPDDTCPLQALTNVSILRTPHDAFRAVAARFPAVAEAFWRHCAVDAAITAQWAVNLGRRDARTRVSHLLCEMAVRLNANPAGEVSFSFPLTQTHLADATGVTPVHINRTLRSLAEDGLVILSDRRVRVTDWESLVRCGQFRAEYLHAGCQPGQPLRMLG